MNPWLQAVMRIAQGHYGGRPNPRWLRSLSYQPEAQRSPVFQNVISQLGLGAPSDVMRMPNR